MTLTITSAGQELISDLIAGLDTAVFTKVQTSSHDYTGSSIEDLTSLLDVKQETSISGIVKKSESVIQISVGYDNTEVDTGYYVRAIGVFARNSNDDEILLGVSVADDVPDYMPAYNGQTVSGLSYKINVAVENAAQVTIAVDPSAVALVSDLEAIEEKEFLRYYGLCNKSTTITDDGADKVITETDTSESVVAVTTISDVSGGKRIVTVVTPTVGDYKWTKTTLIASTADGKQITESYVKEAKS
jgi:hypothetical protein